MNIKVIIIILIGLIIIVGGFIYFSYRSDIKQVYKRVEREESNILETSFGKVEYVSLGHGTPVLMVHGIVGGYDQAAETAKGLVGEGYQILGVSRFGYLRSSLPEEGTPANQARVYKELVDDLGIDKAVVIAVSAGGAPAIRFALNYPERTKALILVGSGAPVKGDIEGLTGPPAFVVNDFAFWSMLQNKKLILFKMFGIDKELYQNATKEEKEELDEILDTLLPVKLRKPGIINDTKVTNRDMIDNYDQYKLEEIEAPTLIIHAKDDPMASFESAADMAERIPGAKFVQYEVGGHLLFGYGRELQNRITRFIREH